MVADETSLQDQPLKKPDDDQKSAEYYEKQVENPLTVSLRRGIASIVCLLVGGTAIRQGFNVGIDGGRWGTARLVPGLILTRLAMFILWLGIPWNQNWA
jgi:hypothetical protein